LDFLLLGGPLKNFQAGQDFEITTGIKYGENFKGLAPSTTPFGCTKYATRKMFFCQYKK